MKKAGEESPLSTRTFLKSYYTRTAMALSSKTFRRQWLSFRLARHHDDRQVTITLHSLHG